jgi:hypothetical protein
MGTETVTFGLGEYDAAGVEKTANVSADVAYLGTEAHGQGRANVERSTVTYAGHEMPGAWRNDARDNVTVERRDIPDDLLPSLMAIHRRQRQESLRRQWVDMDRAQRLHVADDWAQFAGEYA